MVAFAHPVAWDSSQLVTELRPVFSFNFIDGLFKLILCFIRQRVQFFPALENLRDKVVFDEFASDVRSRRNTTLVGIITVIWMVFAVNTGIVGCDILISFQGVETSFIFVLQNTITRANSSHLRKNNWCLRCLLGSLIQAFDEGFHFHFLVVIALFRWQEVKALLDVIKVFPHSVLVLSHVCFPRGCGLAWHHWALKYTCIKTLVSGYVCRLWLCFLAPLLINLLKVAKVLKLVCLWSWDPWVIAAMNFGPLLLSCSLDLCFGDLLKNNDRRSGFEVLFVATHGLTAEKHLSHWRWNSRCLWRWDSRCGATLAAFFLFLRRKVALFLSWRRRSIFYAAWLSNGFPRLFLLWRSLQLGSFINNQVSLVAQDHPVIDFGFFEFGLSSWRLNNLLPVNLIQLLLIRCDHVRRLSSPIDLISLLEANPLLRLCCEVVQFGGWILRRGLDNLALDHILHVLIDQVRPQSLLD